MILENFSKCDSYQLQFSRLCIPEADGYSRDRVRPGSEITLYINYNNRLNEKIYISMGTKHVRNYSLTNYGNVISRLFIV